MLNAATAAMPGVPRAAALCLATLLLTAPTGGRARAADGLAVDARTVLKRINARYEVLHATPRRVVMDFINVSRVPGQPDVRTFGTAVAYQKDRKIRFELPEEAYEVEVPEGGEEYAARMGGDVLWIHDGRLFWSRYELPGAEPDDVFRVAEFFIDHGRMPEEFGVRFTQPMMAAEIPEEFLEHEFTISTGELKEEPVYVLRSAGPIPLSPRTTMAVTLWVDPESYLVSRMESESAWSDPQHGFEGNVSSEFDIAYEFDVELPDALFEVQISPHTEDRTEETKERVREKLEWQGKLPN